MAMATVTALQPRFREGALREVRKPQGSQKMVASKAGVSASTLGRAERGGVVKNETALLIACAMSIMKPGIYDLNHPAVKAALRKFMLTTTKGRIPKGWAHFLHQHGAATPRKRSRAA